MLKKMAGSIKKFVKQEEAQGLTEYGLIIALVVIVVIVGVTALGTKLSGIFDKIQSSLGGSTSTTTTTP